MDPSKKTYSESWEGGKGGVNANIGGKDTPSQSCPWIKGGGCACPLTQFLMYRWCSSLPFLPLKTVFGDQWRKESALTFVSCGFVPRVTGSPVEHGISPVCFLEPALGKTRTFLVRKEKNFMEGLVGGRTNKTAHDAGLHGPSKQPVLLNLCCSPQDEGLLPHCPAPGASSLSLVAGCQHRSLPFTQSLPETGHSWVKTVPANAGDIRDAGSIPGSGRSPGEGNDNSLQDSYLENPTDRGTWWATVHGVAIGRTWLSELKTTFWDKRFGGEMEALLRASAALFLLSVLVHPATGPLSWPWVIISKKRLFRSRHPLPLLPRAALLRWASSGVWRASKSQESGWEGGGKPQRKRGSCRPLSFLF